MICKVQQTIEKYNLINEKDKTVTVALSGGADSSCLLDVLLKLKEVYCITVKAVHLNHNIRGKEADSDEIFVRRLCESKEVELTVFSIDVPELARERKLSLEECGRQVRYECFKKVDTDFIATAHTLSDSIETMLFNLARGTGAKGLAGISPAREPNIIRPLITCTRSEVEKYCADNSVPFVTDSTNLSDDYTRNYIRHNIVPCFSKINPDFEKSFFRAMNSIDEIQAYIDKGADILGTESKSGNGYCISVLNRADKAVLKRFIHNLLKKVMNKPPETKHIEAVSKLIADGIGKIELAKDLYIIAEGDIINFSCAEKPTEEWKCYFTDGVAKSPFAEYCLIEDDIPSIDSFDADRTEGDLFLSSRLPGDSFTFKNRNLTKSIKKLFNELKIPSSVRNSIAVLHDGKNVVWIENVGVNSKYIPDENTQKIITVKRTDKND